MDHGSAGWLGAGPPVTDVAGVATVKAWKLVVPTGTAAPRFEGAHYCTLIAPEYLRSVLLGDTEL